jgi:hypothetical protein
MIDDIKRKLQQFFPRERFTTESVEQGLAEGDILTGRENILRYLQTALFDEKVLEVELDGMPMVYFSRLKDDLPELIEDVVDGKVVWQKPDYTEGEYLTYLSHIVTLPLEPGLGNLHLRYSRYIVLRMFTSTFAVEMATTFEDLDKVHDLPVLRLAYPELARIVRKAREFRAKVPESLDFIISTEIDEETPEVQAIPINIGLKGIAFTASKAEQRMFKLNSVCSLKLYLHDELLAKINGTVRHISRIRKKFGIEYVCGIEFDLQTKIHAAVVESIVATVQRAHLKELADKSDATGINLIT